MHAAPFAFLVVAVLVAAIGAWIDWRTGHIPNWVTLVPLGAAPLAHFGVTAAAARPLTEAAQAAGFSVLGAFVCAIVPVVLFRAGAIGGGDVKLLAAIGALCRPMVGIEAEFYAFMAAAIIAPARLAWEGKLLRVLGNTLALVINPFLPKKKRREIAPEMLTSIRFGPAIFAGTLIAALLHWRLP
jgi:prepilin peptidase CpaA